MRFTKNLIQIRSRKYSFRYDQSLDQWEILDSNGIVYMGSKKSCQTYLKYAGYNY